MNLENIILAYLIKDKKFTMELVNSIDTKYFSDKRWIFSIVKDYFLNPKFKEIPTISVMEEIIKREFSGEVDSKKNDFVEICNLSKSVDEKEFGWNLERFKTRYNNAIQKESAEKIIGILSQNLSDNEKLESANKTLKETSSKIDSIFRKQIYKEGSLNENAKERFLRYEQIEKNPEIARGILTGFTAFDKITNGLHGGELMIIAGETGTGKSVLMHNIGVNAYVGTNNSLEPDSIMESGYNVLYFSLEMPKESMERRLDSCMADVYYNQLRDGNLSPEDKKKYFNCARFQMKHNKKFHIIDMPKKITTRDIEVKFLEILENKFKPDLVIVDYMGIMSSNGSAGTESDWFSLGQISEELHEFARIYNIPVITASQVNRTKDPTKQEYSTNRIARSGMAPTNANIIIQIGARDDEYLRSDMPIYLTKMRDGEKGSFTLNKNFAKMKVLNGEQDFSTSDKDDSI